MPLYAIPTTIDVIQDAFVARLTTLVPRMVRGRDDRWQHIARQQTPSMGTRLYRFEWDLEGLTPSGFMWRGGAALDVTCSIIVDYGGIPSHELDAIANDDHQQLWDALDALRRTVDGLRRVRSAGWTQEASSSPDQAQVVHQYLVTYLQARYTS